MPSSLTQALSAVISSILDDGSYDVLYQKWFDASPGGTTHPYPPSEQYAFPRHPEGTLARAFDRGALHLGFAVMGPPFSQEKDGKVIGWDLELGSLLTDVLAGQYGATLQAVHVRVPGAPFPGRLFDELDADRCDAVLSDLAITDERLRRVDFTCPYLCVTFGLLCRGNSSAATRLASSADADRPELRLLVLRRAFLNELADRSLPNATRCFVDDPVDIVPTLLAGRADAALLPFASIRAYLAAHQELRCPEFTIGPGGLRAIATRKSAR